MWVSLYKILGKSCIFLDHTVVKVFLCSHTVSFYSFKKTLPQYVVYVKLFNFLNGATLYYLLLHYANLGPHEVWHDGFLHLFPIWLFLHWVCQRLPWNSSIPYGGCLCLVQVWKWINIGTLISLINVTSSLPILENSTLHKTKIPPAGLLILLQT